MYLKLVQIMQIGILSLSCAQARMTAHSASCQLGSTALSSLLRSFIKEALKHGLHSSDIGYNQDMHTQSRWCERQDVWIMHALMHCCFPFITYNYVQTLLFANTPPGAFQKARYTKDTDHSTT